MDKTSEKSSRIHQKIKLVVYGRYTFGKLKGQVNKAIEHTVTLFTGQHDGVIESVHDRLARFVTEATNGVQADTPAYKITSIEPV